MSEGTNVTQNMCPYCIQALSDRDVVIQFWEWQDGQSSGPLWGRLDCVLYASAMERREHPPKGE